MLDNLLQRLLGPAGSLRLDQLFFLKPWTMRLTVGVLGAFAAWFLWCYFRDGKRPSWFWKLPLVLVRLCALAILVLLVWQPMARSTHTEVVPSIVAVVVDQSRSMSIRDRWQDARRRQDLVRALSDSHAPEVSRMEVLNRLLGQDRSAFLRSLLASHSVRLYRFGGETRVAEVRVPKRGAQPAKRQAGLETLPITAIPAVSNQTRIGNALEFVLGDTAGQPLASIVLLSDGGQNLGEDPVVPARRAKEMHVPVYTVGFGDPTPPKDLSVATLLADEVVRKGDEAVVNIGLRQRGFTGRTVPLTVKLGGQVLRKQDIQLVGGTGAQQLSIPYTPTEVGAKTLTVSIPGQSGEVTVANNQKAFPLRVVDKQLKILYVEGSPRWEYRYLKNAIRGDESIQFACLLTESPDPARGGEGNLPIYGFPKTRKGLFDYDLLILGDVAREYFDPEDLKNIAAFVQERGGSIITIAGQNHTPWEYRNTELETVWPMVVPNTRRDELFREPFVMELTDEGARNPMLLLDPDAEENRKVWASLPGLYWCGVTDRVKPGATVLARHPTEMGPDGKIPLMAAQQAGEGTSFMTMVDSTWLWRHRVYDKYFYRFWGQLVRSLTPHELPGKNRFIRLTTDRSTYALGEKVVIRTRLLTPTYHPVRASYVMAQVRAGNGIQSPVKLEPVVGAPGVFSGEWEPARPGDYQVSVNGPDDQHGEGLTHVVVEASDLEMEEQQQNEHLLRGVAAAGGGRYLLWSELSALPKKLPDPRQVVKTQVTQDLWDVPLPIVVFILLLLVEWTTRKRLGML